MITVIGIDGSPLSEVAAAALAGAELVVGARRHLDLVQSPQEAQTIVMGPIAPALNAVAEHSGHVVVLASGDPGFFGIVRLLRERHLAPVVYPAASSVSHAFARIGMSWEDAVVVSAHGRDLRPAVNVARAFPKVAVLTAPGAGPAEIGAALASMTKRLVVAVDLGGPHEQVVECSPTEAANRSWTEPAVVLVVDTEPQEGRAPSSPSWCWPTPTTPNGWALPEDDFEHRDRMITKSEVRAVVLARLAPRPGELILDVGAGSGSVAVECARFGAAVVAIERDPEQCARIRRNAERHSVHIEIVAADAAEVEWPVADAVFVGGGGVEVLRRAASNEAPRIVVALAAVERVGPAIDVLNAADYMVEGICIQASRLTTFSGNSHRLAAANPVFVLWGRHAEGTK